MTQDLFFRATSRRAWARFAQETGLVADGQASDGVDIDIIENLVHKAAVRDADGNITTPAIIDLTHVHINLRLTGSGEQSAAAVRKTFTDANDRRAVASRRRAGKTHAWLHKVFTGGDAGAVGLIEPPPETRARIWFGDPAPAVGRS